MRGPWYWYLALKQLFPTGKRGSFFAYVAMFGVTVGVMVLMVVMSVMTGFGERIRDTVRDTSGDVRVVSNSVLFDYEVVQAELAELDFVESIAPYAEGVVMMKYGDKPLFPAIRGIDPVAESTVLPLDEFMFAGEFEDLDDLSVIVGKGIADGLGLRLGEEIEVFSPLMLSRLKEDEVLLPRALEVGGVFETGWAKIDNKVIMVSLETMQDLYGLDGGIHGFTINIKDGTDAFYASEEIGRRVEKYGLSAFNWMQMNEPFLFVIKLEKTMMFFIIIFVIIVAAFSIASSLMTTVVRKTREIGLLGAMGARPSQLAKLFCLQGFLIGLVGTGLGVLFSFIAITYRNNIVHGLMNLLNREETIQDFYQFTDIPAVITTSDVLTIVLSAIVIATLAGVFPAFRAARMKPAEAMRND